jgi:uncharacterized membrane protein
MRLGKWHRALVLAALIVVALTGVVWFVLHDVAGEAPDELLREVLMAHGVAAFATMMAFGSVLPLHSLAGWRKGQNVGSGLSVILVLAVLAVTGLMLYYANEVVQSSARLVHLVVGFAAIAGVPLHIWLGRRGRLK